MIIIYRVFNYHYYFEGIYRTRELRRYAGSRHTAVVPRMFSKPTMICLSTCLRLSNTSKICMRPATDVDYSCVTSGGGCTYCGRVSGVFRRRACPPICIRSTAREWGTCLRRTSLLPCIEFHTSNGKLIIILELCAVVFVQQVLRYT